MSLSLRTIEAAHSGGGGAGAGGAVDLDLGETRYRRFHVTAAEVALAGFDAEYTDGDHHVLEIVVQLAPPRVVNDAEGSTVTLHGRLGLRGNGDFEQPFRVRVRCLLLADVERI